jgi:hypothetical protein
MAESEIILNLWYVHDDMGLIYSLRVRAYVGTGTDDEKLALLHRFANLDYLIARPFPIPDRFHLEIEENGTRTRIAAAPQEYLNGLDSPIALFEDAIKEIEADFPAQTGLNIPKDPLMCSTALLADDAGRLYSGRRTLRLCREEEAIEVAEPTWALIIAFLKNHGWKRSIPGELFSSGNDEMIQEDALALAETGQAILCQALKDPRAIQIRFDLEKFAEIADFASAGAFIITR